MVTPLGGHDTALGGLLDREADAPALKVEVDDLHPELLIRGDHLLGELDVVGRHLRDVDQALDAVSDLDERAERDQLGDPAVDQLADLMALGELLPGILLGGLQRQADALTATVDVEHLHLDLVADGDHSARVVDMLPGELRHVDQPVHAAQVHECTEVDDAGYHARPDLARTQVVEEVLALLLLGLFQPGSPGQDDVVAVLVELDDLGLDGGVHVGLQVAHAAQLDQGGGEEATESDVDDQATLDDLDHRAVDHAVAFLDVLDAPPGAFVLGTLLGEDEAALVVLAVDHHGLDALTDGNDLTGVHTVADRQLARRDDALRLVPDVQENLVPVDPHDGALDDLPVGDIDHRGRVGLVEGKGSEVVEDDLAGDVLAACVECAHGRRVEGGIGGSQVGHGGLSRGQGSGTGKNQERFGYEGPTPGGTDQKSLSPRPGNPFGNPDQAERDARSRNSGLSMSGGRRP